jgi:hypothetical protein
MPKVVAFAWISAPLVTMFRIVNEPARGLVNPASPASALESQIFKQSDTTTPTKNAEGILILQVL